MAEDDDAQSGETKTREAERPEAAVMAGDSYEWNEDDHDRDDQGRFTAKGGGSGGGETLDLIARGEKGEEAGPVERPDPAPQTEKQEASAQPRKRELAAQTEKQKPTPQEKADKENAEPAPISPGAVEEVLNAFPGIGNTIEGWKKAVTALMEAFGISRKDAVALVRSRLDVGLTHKIATEQDPEAAKIMSATMVDLQKNDTYAEYIALLESGDVDAVNKKILQIDHAGDRLAVSDKQGTAKLQAELMLLIYGETFYNEFAQLKKRQADLYFRRDSVTNAKEKKAVNAELDRVNQSLDKKTSAVGVFGETFVKSQEALAERWQTRMSAALESREIRGYIQQIDALPAGEARDTLLADMLLASAKAAGMPVNLVKFETNMGGTLGETVGTRISLNANLLARGAAVSYEQLMITFFHEAGHAWSNTDDNKPDGSREKTLLSRMDIQSGAAGGMYNIHPRELQAKLFESHGLTAAHTVNKLRQKKRGAQ